MLVRISIAACLLAAGLSAAPRWEVQYQYKDIDSTFTISDMVFASQKRGVVCGTITDRKAKARSIALVTNNAGAAWTQLELKESCISLFFLDDAFGWMVTDKGIWATAESGRTWNKLKTGPPNMLRVWFLDMKHGYATGRGKQVFETHDAGDTWLPLAVATEAQGEPLYTTYGEIAFNGKRGMIAGWNIPPQVGGPEWLEQRTTRIMRPTPHLSIALQTKDGGATWIKDEASLFGHIARLSLSAQGSALGLIQYAPGFEFSSEVFRINQNNGKSSQAFRQKGIAITDVRVFDGVNRGYVAGYETPGLIAQGPIPGKLKVYSSDDLEHWTDMNVDYRAVAHGAIIAGPDEAHVWIATDTGLILRLVNE